MHEFTKFKNVKIEGEKLNDASFLSYFMKKNGILISAQERSIAKYFLFENDEIITYLLIDCHPEEDNQYDQQMQNLLTKMLKDKEIYNNYIFCSTYFLTTKNLTIPSYLELFINEYEQNPNDFKNIVNQFLFF